jgi:hypothetical protein
MRLRVIEGGLHKATQPIDHPGRDIAPRPKLEDQVRVVDGLVPKRCWTHRSRDKEGFNFLLEALHRVHGQDRNRNIPIVSIGLFGQAPNDRAAHNEDMARKPYSSEELVAARNRLRARLENQGRDAKWLSGALEKNHAYIQQYLNRGVPAVLSRKDRLKIAALLSMPFEDLSPKGHEDDAVITNDKRIAIDPYIISNTVDKLEVIALEMGFKLTAAEIAHLAAGIYNEAIRSAGLTASPAEFSSVIDTNIAAWRQQALATKRGLKTFSRG